MEENKTQYYGKGINDNSDSYKIEKFIEDFCGIDQDKKIEDPSYGLTKEILQSNLISLYHTLKHDRPTTYLEWQTFFHMICFLGVEVSHELIEEGINHFIEDEWAKNDLERKIIIDNAISLMSDYVNCNYMQVNIDLNIDYSNGHARDFYGKNLSEEEKKCNIRLDLIERFEEYYNIKVELYTDMISYYMLVDLSDEELAKLQRHFFGIKLIRRVK